MFGLLISVPEDFCLRRNDKSRCLEKLCTVGDGVFRAGEGDIAFGVSESGGEAFGDEGADLFGGEVDDGDDLGADELFGGVVVGDLGG